MTAASGNVNFERCNVCRRSFQKGKKHVYSAKHIEAVRQVLTKFSSKVDNAYAAVGSPQIKEDATGDKIWTKFWCYFCSAEVQQHLAFDGWSYLTNSGFLEHVSSSEHQQMVRTFWRINRIRNPKTAASGCSDSVQKVSSDGQKVGHTILEDYQNDIKKRFHNSNAPLQWKDWLESQKTKSQRTTMKSSVEEGITISLPNAAASLKLQASEMPNSSASSVASSVSTLAWRMEAFFLSPEDFQRFCNNAKRCIDEHFAQVDERCNKEAQQIQMTDEKRRRFMELLRQQKTSQHEPSSSSSESHLRKSQFQSAKSTAVGMRTIAAHGEGLTCIKRPKLDETQGNVHSGARPPWLDAATDVDATVQSCTVIGPTADDLHKHLAQQKKSKLPSTRVGAMFDHRGPSTANWLPLFGRVWSKNCRTHNQNRFMKERHIRKSKSTGKLENSLVGCGDTLACSLDDSCSTSCSTDNVRQPVVPTSDTSGQRTAASGKVYHQYQRRRERQIGTNERDNAVSRLGIAPNLL